MTVVSNVAIHHAKESDRDSSAPSFLYRTLLLFVFHAIGAAMSVINA